MLDLDYSEDSHAEVDMNVVGTDAGTYIELQGTAEGAPFDRQRVGSLLDLAMKHRDTPIAGRTHGQPGAPATFGWKAAFAVVVNAIGVAFLFRKELANLPSTARHDTAAAMPLACACPPA